MAPLAAVCKARLDENRGRRSGNEKKTSKEGNCCLKAGTQVKTPKF
jgi:hypothetical protein